MGLLRSRNNGVEPHLEEKAKERMSTDYIEHSSSTSAGIVENGAGHAVVGSSDEDVPLTQEDIDFVTKFDEEGRGRKTLLKTDLRLIPILVIIYLAAFLDRGNIGTWPASTAVSAD